MERVCLCRFTVGSRSNASIALVLGVLGIGCVDLEVPPNQGECAARPQGCADDQVALQPDARRPSDDSSADRSSDGRADSGGVSMPGRFAGQEAGSEGRARGATGRDATRTDTHNVSRSTDAPDDVIVADALPSADGPSAPEADPDLGGAPDGSSDLAAPEPPSDGAAPEPLPDATNQDDASAAVDSRADEPRAGDLYEVQPSSCIERLIANGYAAGSAPSCSLCTDGNGGSIAAKCTAMIDCLAPPRTSADFNYCLNFVKGSSLVRDCVAGILQPACPDGY